MSMRHPAVAGSFYPATPQQLHDQIVHFLAQAPAAPVPPKALIVPHAGYRYSGLTAAHAYRQLESVRQHIRRVVLLGPSHRVALRGLAMPESKSFQTPLGEVAIDHRATEGLIARGEIKVSQAAHAQEHSLEVQLPFLQATLNTFSLIPLVVGECDKTLVAEVLDELWGGEETLIVISTDLSHYHPYECARILDTRTSSEIEAFHTDLSGEQACGCFPLNGFLLAAQRQGMHIKRLDLRNSGDTGGDQNRVVGYGAYALF